MSLAAGVRAMHTHGKAFNFCWETHESGVGVRAMHACGKTFNICWETHESGLRSECNAHPDT